MVAHAQAPAETERPASPVALWRHIFGEGTGFLCLFSGRRPAPGSKQLLDVAESYWPYPQSLAFAEQEAYQQDALGREVYFCAHLLRRKRRVKASAGPIDALWTDGDGAPAPSGALCPTAVVESSPGRQQFFWRLTEPVEPAEAEQLNRRLAYAIGADKGGWDRTQLLRVPGCTNHKYPDTPIVALDHIRAGAATDAASLDALLPPAPAPIVAPTPAPVPDDNDDTEPPVRLGADGLAWWRGERIAHKEDGGVDRSRTLWAIACALWEAGASRGTVVAALTERDGTLGHGCFTGRPEEYARIAGKLVEAPPAPTLATGDCETCTKLRELLARERKQKEEVIALNRAMRKVLANDKLKQEGRAALGIAFEVWDAREREDRTRVVPGGDGLPFYEYHPASAGKKVAMSADAISTAKTRMETWDLLNSTTKRKCERNAETGEEKWTRESYLHIDAASIPDWLERVAAFEPSEEECTKARKGKWGGRPECPRDPEAVVCYDVTATCTECGAVIDEHRTFRDAEGEIVSPPAGWSPDPPDGSQPHLAAYKGTRTIPILEGGHERDCPVGRNSSQPQDAVESGGAAGSGEGA